MVDIRKYISGLLDVKQIKVPANRTALFDAFISEEQNVKAVNHIKEYQKMITDKWVLKNRIADIDQQPVTVPNGTVGKPYMAVLDLKKLGWTDFVHFELAGVEEVGLSYDRNSCTIAGIPTKSGDIKLTARYRLQLEPETSTLNEKTISLIINPDPKSLWKDVPSSKDDPYWKEDNVAEAGTLGDRHIVVASKRGRSHANVGSFRDDDYAYKYFEKTGWGVVVVSDGAGSAKASRKGSLIACNAITDYFKDCNESEAFCTIDGILQDHKNGTGEDTQKKLTHFVYNNLGQAALFAHKRLEEFATTANIALKDLHATLIYVLIKKYAFGYAIFSFGVGDCPIGMLTKDMSSVTLLNWLDVGEFGGGTRFITMPEVFKSDKFSTRFGFRLVEDFSYLMLMTDGIYDPKFVVEANLEKIDKWKEFIDDLQGRNEDNAKVDLDPANPAIASQLSAWMDFWSSGNHDDRTLAIIY